MKHLFLCAIAGALLATPTFAQGRASNGNNSFGRGGGAVFQLPPRVQNVVSIDAFNMLIIASQGARRGETQYTPTIIQHVYSGGIARLFGGTSVPTAPFVTPGQFGNNNNGGGVAASGGNQNNFGGGVQNGFGGSGFNTPDRNVSANARMRAR